MPDEISKTGLWVDRDSGKLVTKKPARGTQVVRQGGVISGAARVRLDALDAKDDAEPVPAHEALGNPAEVDTSDSGQIEAVTTTDAKPVAKRTAKKSK